MLYVKAGKMNNPSAQRNEYKKNCLNEHQLPCNPIELFEEWLKLAFDSETIEPTAMTLSTANASGRISSRIVLLKGFDMNGFQFYANYNSRKGRNLHENNFAALNFFWPEMEKQVRIEGLAKKISERDSDMYHDARPRNNQISAWASNQSETIKDRATLEAQFKAVNKVYDKQDSVPRPPHWGGYRLIPDKIEFWQGRESRLHDRIEYNKDGCCNWKIQRLNP